MHAYVLQWFLTKLGYNPGPIDAVIGPKTRAAISAFQADRGHHVTGTITAALIEAFNKEVVPGRWPAWVHNALSFIGVEEVPGAASNPTIMKWALDLNIRYDGDHIAWCGLLVAAMLHEASTDTPLPDNVLGARQYLTIGQKIDPSAAEIGDLAIFWRIAKSDWRGHVGFYMGAVGDQIIVLGGNQSNSVSIIMKDRAKLLGIRRPVIAGKAALSA